MILEQSHDRLAFQLEQESTAKLPITRLSSRGARLPKPLAHPGSHFGTINP